MMKRRHRVRSSKRFAEIRQQGRSAANELLVLYALPNELGFSRFGFSVSGRIGNAVIRNRVKRRLREAVRLQMDQIAMGWDMIWIARRPISKANYHEIFDASARLLRRARLLAAAPVANDSPGDSSTTDHA